MDKRALTERDICTKYITPALVARGWDVHLQVRENVYLTDGRVIVRGKLVTRGQRKFADYVLFHKPNLPLAVIEAKDANHSVGDGMQQALGYAEMMDVPFVFSSNGDAFLFHDRTGQSAQVEQQLTLAQFPSPAELWQRYCVWKGIAPASEPVIAQDYYSDGGGKVSARAWTTYLTLRAKPNVLAVFKRGGLTTPESLRPGGAGPPTSRERCPSGPASLDALLRS